MSSDYQQIDKRLTCKYGVSCYQKNPEHHKKYKHPPKRTQQDLNLHEPKAKKARSVDIKDVNNEERKAKEVHSTRIDVKDKPGQTPAKLESALESTSKYVPKHSNDISDSDDDDTQSGAKQVEMVEISKDTNLNDTKAKEMPYKDLEPKSFIKDKFLVDMPADFYKFWDFCKTINAQNPSAALKDADLLLVGPYDVLNGKFANANKEFSKAEFLTHWRYYYDIPEFQTVLKGNDASGYHIGYFRDEPHQKPVFMACNSAQKDGSITSLGENIFAAVCLYLEEKGKICDPFRKLKFTKLLNLIKREADNLNYSLMKKTDDMKTRDRKTVTKSLNKIGIVVPFNIKTQLGYRELAMNDKELNSNLQKLKQVDNPRDQDLVLDTLQPLFTHTNIAIDECDFGTGIELGWNLFFYGIERLNKTIARFLRNSYNLLSRKEFADIIVAHMENRRKGSKLSILKH